MRQRAIFNEETAMLNFKLPVSMELALLELAKKEYRRKSDVVREAVAEYIERRKANGDGEAA